MVQNFGAGLKDGWNHLRLPIASAGTSGGPCDLRRVNFFRIHLLGLHTAKNNELILKLDNIYLSVVQDGVEDYPEEVTPPAGGEEIPPVGGEELPPVDGEDNMPSGEDNTPSGEDNVPPVGENTDSEQTPADDTAAQLAQRKALTARRSRIVVLLFAFLIVGTDIVVVALRRRSEAEIAPDAEGQMQQALDVSKAADPEQETPGQDGGPTADQ
jgi:hypothetical protein